jgi:hypothetical protein
MTVMEEAGVRGVKLHIQLLRCLGELVAHVTNLAFETLSCLVNKYDVISHNGNVNLT